MGAGWSDYFSRLQKSNLNLNIGLDCGYSYRSAHLFSALIRTHLGLLVKASRTGVVLIGILTLLDVCANLKSDYPLKWVIQIKELKWPTRISFLLRRRQPFL